MRHRDDVANLAFQARLKYEKLPLHKLNPPNPAAPFVSWPYGTEFPWATCSNSQRTRMLLSASRITWLSDSLSSPC